MESEEIARKEEERLQRTLSRVQSRGSSVSLRAKPYSSIPHAQKSSVSKQKPPQQFPPATCSQRSNHVKAPWRTKTVDTESERARIERDLAEQRQRDEEERKEREARKQLMRSKWDRRLRYVYYSLQLFYQMLSVVHF